MSRITCLFLVLTLAGCEMRVGSKPRACTTKQILMMDKYLELCERGSVKNYCFDKAQEAYCEETKK
jgi:hypothetical protein